MNWLRVICWMAASAITCTGFGAPNTWTLTSPNGKVEATLSLKDGKLAYRVSVAGQGMVLNPSSLGVMLKGQDLAASLEIVAARGPTEVHASYKLVHGKRLQCSNDAREITLSLLNPLGTTLEVDFRAYNDGVAFRYRVPGAADAATFQRELTTFAIPEDARLWAAPADKAGTYSPAYETYYENGVPMGAVASNGHGWSFPMLLKTRNGSWALITESAVDTTFCGSRLSSAPTNGAYSVELPIEAEGNGTGSIYPVAKLPWTMPWRVVIAGDSLATIVESTLVTDVHPPQEVADTSWIRPGRVAWSWWSDNPSPKDAVKQKQFVDLAAEMGWEYMLVDANWTIMEKGNVQEVLQYAKDKGVGVLLWYNSGGPHNLVTEKPRDTLTYGPVRKFELDLLKGWGVKGIKVDFFQSDKQNVVSLYHEILRQAAEAKVMINFHGCTLPRGWERQYPHLMSMEAVRGAECYIFDSKYPDAAPVQNTILPFTRNVVGPMDYTPVTLSNHNYPHKTTAAHELALAVLFQSGWVHFADRAEAYRALPEVWKSFLKEAPVVWDETRFVSGEPGDYVILARRKGNDWYLSGVNGRNEAREVSVKLGAWFQTDRATLTSLHDEPTLDAKAVRWTENERALSATMAPRGGFVAILKGGN